MKKRDLSKLPAWARQYIQTLENNLRNAREENTRIAEGVTDTWIRDMVNERRIHLPDGAVVAFRTSGGDVFEVRTSRYAQDLDNALHVSVGDRLIAVVPWASNLIHITTTHR